MTVFILCVRDPDASNEYTVEPADADVQIIDVDLGSADLTAWEEFHPWAFKHLTTAEQLPEGKIRTTVEDLVWSEFEDSVEHFNDKWPSYRADITDLGRNIPHNLKDVDGVDHLLTLLK